MGRILHVDDDVTFSKSWRSRWELNGHTVTSCHTAYEAKELLKDISKLFDVIILDGSLTKRGREGPALAWFSRTHRPQTPIIGFSGAETNIWGDLLGTPLFESFEKNFDNGKLKVHLAAILPPSA